MVFANCIWAGFWRPLANDLSGMDLGSIGCSIGSLQASKSFFELDNVPFPVLKRRFHPVE